jgi:hypothetical protein
MTADRFPVEASHILMFARSIGDEGAGPRGSSPADTDLPSDGFAPPTFAIAGAHFDPDWQLRPCPPEPWFGSAAEPSGADRKGSGRLHAEQHFEYHRSLRAGDVLRGEDRPGRTWEKQSRRGDTLRFEEWIIDYRDATTGELVVTSRMVGVLADASTAEKA